MTNLPKTVQWVLDFLNINNTPGKPDLYRFPYERRSLKRPPIPKRTSNLELTNNGLIDKSTGYQWRIRNNKPEDRVDTFEVQKRLRQLEKKKTKLLEKLGIKAQENTIENMIEEWKKTAPKQSDLEIMENLDLEKDIEFEGINNAPTLADYKQFFLKEGIPPLTGEELVLENGKSLLSLDTDSLNNRPKNNNNPGFYNYYYDPPIEFKLYISISEIVWGELSRILSNIVWGTKTYENEDTGYASLMSYLRHIRNLYLECLEKDMRRFKGTEFGERISMVAKSREYEKPLPHYGVLPHALYARVLDLKINHEELRSRLRQCQYCGKFWIPDNDKKRGRRNKFCSDVCRNKDDDQSREANKKSVETTRKHQNKEKQKEDCRTLAEYLKQKGHPENEAKEIAQEWVYTYGKSFKEYKRTQGTILKGL